MRRCRAAGTGLTDLVAARLIVTENARAARGSWVSLDSFAVFQKSSCRRTAAGAEEEGGAANGNTCVQRKGDGQVKFQELKAVVCLVSGVRLFPSVQN